nr:atp-dependent rna helicase drs1 [Quercus suber]
MPYTLLQCLNRITNDRTWQRHSRRQRSISSSGKSCQIRVQKTKLHKPMTRRDRRVMIFKILGPEAKPKTRYDSPACGLPGCNVCGVFWEIFVREVDDEMATDGIASPYPGAAAQNELSNVEFRTRWERNGVQVNECSCNGQPIVEKIIAPVHQFRMVDMAPMMDDDFVGTLSDADDVSDGDNEVASDLPSQAGTKKRKRDDKKQTAVKKQKKVENTPEEVDENKEKDDDMLSDFEFESTDRAAHLEDFDGWAINDNKVAEVNGAMDIDAIVARRRGDITKPATDSDQSEVDEIDEEFSEGTSEIDEETAEEDREEGDPEADTHSDGDDDVILVMNHNCSVVGEWQSMRDYIRSILQLLPTSSSASLERKRNDLARQTRNRTHARTAPPWSQYQDGSKIWKQQERSLIQCPDTISVTLNPQLSPQTPDALAIHWT